MKRTKTMSFAVIVVIAALFSLWGCPKKADVTATPEGQKETAGAELSATGSTSEAASQTPSASPREGAAAAGGGLQPVYFDFDKTFIRDDAKGVLKANVEWLKSHPAAKVRIEGNCDERGTIEYNQALGQRRSASAKEYLVALGVPASRISLISYGKEKSICSEQDEACWQKNRRDDFVPVND